MARRVGASNDCRQMIERWIVDVVDANECVERAWSSPSWANSTPSMSNGVPPISSAMSTDPIGSDMAKKSRAFGSMKRRISQGQAMRSIFGRALGHPFVCAGVAFEMGSGDAGLAQRGGRGLADFSAVGAVNDNRLGRRRTVGSSFAVRG